MMNKIKKTGQSEIVGFGIIVIIISLLILIFISFSLQKNENEFSESSKTDSFIQATLQFTTTCERNTVHLDYLDLIESCDEERICDNGENPCETLNSTSRNLVLSAWKAGEEYPVKGYLYEVRLRGETLVSLAEGNVTGTSKGSRQTFSGEIEISLIAYY
ncbi:MAG: hypothetical protein Q8Q04_02585 [archaeon]|nr:hypothetical protein [archaeon]